MSTRDISVVICVYTEDRWEDILAAVSSVRAQSLPALETLLVVDHNTVLLERLAGEYRKTEGVRVLANAGPAVCPPAATPGSRPRTAVSSPSSTTTPSPSGTGCGISPRATPTRG